MNRVRALSKRAPSAGNIDWNKVILHAQELVESYDTGVTLRQLYYRLVSKGMIPNSQNHYKKLSAKTAQARREGWFPPLIDRTRAIERYPWWYSAQDSMDDALEGFRFDRTQGQQWSIYIGVEKHGMTVQLMHWFGELGIPILALGGYSSQTFVDVVRRNVERYDRPSVLLYAGDFDPSGVDIDRDFEERTEIFDEVVRVALRREHITEYNLPPMPGKAADSRSASFILKHGELIQVELDALEPQDLRKLYQTAVDRYWDKKAYQKTLVEEAREREKIEFLHSHVESTPRHMIEDILDGIDNEADAVELHDATYERLSKIRGW